MAKTDFMAAVGLSCGFAVAGGLFALIIALGLVAEFADQTHTAKHIFWYEDAVAAGGILGNLMSVYQLVLPVGRWVWGFSALSAAFLWEPGPWH